MKVVLQTVDNASVLINKEAFSKINKGYLLLVGFCIDDDEKICDLMADKIIKLRVFPDDNGQTNLSIFDVDGDILSVSQFTLYADTSKGRRPSFVNAMHPMVAKPLYEYFNKQLTKLLNKTVYEGVFGADMEVLSSNKGPFTLVLDSKLLWPK